MIFDASPIIAFFSELEDPGTLLLIRKMGYDLYVPAYVCQSEVTKNPSFRYLSECLKDGHISRLPSIDPQEISSFQNKHPQLGIGECEVILSACTFEMSGLKTTCIIDDGPARKVAKSMGISVIGTIGLIGLLRNEGLIDPEKEMSLKSKLRSSSFRADSNLL